MHPDDLALVLTPWFAPHAVAPWYESVTAVLTRKATVLEEYDSEICSPSVRLRTPAVILLRKPLARTKSDVKFSRANVYARDRYRCAYCGLRFAPEELTYDHVLPRAGGGKTDFANIVTACKPCNGRKGNRTPEQAGMRLLARPHKPASLPLGGCLRLPGEVPDLWVPYLEGHRTVRMVG